MRHCKTCGNAEDEHPYRHPFKPERYPATPKDPTAQKWDGRFMEMAHLTASWSKDPSTKVGCVIVDTMRTVVALGYNGFPRGVDDSPERYADREQKYPRVVHSELNAILNANGPVRGCVLYCTFPPCCECAKAIIQSGINRVVIPLKMEEEEEARWTDSVGVAFGMFEEAGIQVSAV